MALPEDPEMLVPAPILIPVAALIGPEASVQAVKTCDSCKVCAEAGAGCGQGGQWLGREAEVAGVSHGAIGLSNNIHFRHSDTLLVCGHVGAAL